MTGMTGADETSDDLATSSDPHSSSNSGVTSGDPSSSSGDEADPDTATGGGTDGSTTGDGETSEDDGEDIDAEIIACVIDGAGVPIPKSSAQSCGPIDAQLQDCQSLVADDAGCVRFTPRRAGDYALLVVQGTAWPERTLTTYMARVAVVDGSHVDLGRVPLVDVGMSTELLDEVVSVAIDDALTLTIDVDHIDFDGYPRELAGARVDASVWPYDTVGDGGQRVAAVWALAPAGPWSAEPIAFELRDTLGLDDGTVVSIYEHDVRLDGAVRKVGEATVDGDGGRIVCGADSFRSWSWLVFAVDTP